MRTIVEDEAGLKSRPEDLLHGNETRSTRRVGKLNIIKLITNFMSLIGNCRPGNGQVRHGGHSVIDA